MRLSLKSALLYVTVFCVCLALTWAPIESGAIAVAVISVCLGFVITFSAWWRMLAGGLLVVSLSYAFLIYKCIEYFASTQNELENATAFMKWWLPYVIQIGAFVGGSLGLLLYGRKQTPSEA